MRVIDVDSHFHEPVDWLICTDPAVAAELPPPPRFREGLALAQLAVMESLPDDFPFPEDPLDFITPSFRRHCEQTDAMQPAHYDPESSDPMYRGDGRVRLLDEVGIDVQWLSPTFTGGLMIQAMRAGRMDLVPRIQRAFNTWAAEQVVGHTHRLKPVTQIHVEDVAFSIAEMRRMREAGSRAFMLTQHPTKSLSHPDFDPMWSAAEELGMVGYVHVVIARPTPHPSWANNGRGVRAFQEPPVTGEEHRSETRKLLTALVVDGVFERHPDLRIVLAETSTSWLPAYLRELDFKTRTVAMDGGHQDPSVDLPLMPSEYIRRHMRVAANIGFTKTGFDYLSLTELYEQLPFPELIVFSSDYPHVEGRSNAVAEFEPYLADDESIRESFFGRSMEEFLVGADIPACR